MELVDVTGQSMEGKAGNRPERSAGQVGLESRGTAASPVAAGCCVASGQAASPAAEEERTF